MECLEFTKNIVSEFCLDAVQVQRDQSEFARLAQLGDVLGLTQIDIHAIHQSLAEQAFSSQVQGVSTALTRSLSGDD